VGRSMFNENNEKVFPYQVNAIMPIIGLNYGNIMVPSTVKLTKEDVATCVKKVPVFRRFKNGKLVKVTISSIDRLHNEEYMSEKEYEEYLDKQADNRGKVTDNIVKENIIEEPKKETSVVNTEEPKEIPVVEPVVEEADTVNINDQTEEPVVETTVENINDEEISENVTESDNSEETNKNEYNHNNRYNGKKKHNR
jgi:hypothetical protein